MQQQHDKIVNDEATVSLMTVIPDSMSSWTPVPRLVLDPIIGNSTKVDQSSSSSPCLSPRGTLLMLHGWAQNTQVFANRSKKLVKRLRQAGYRVIFLQAPHRLPPKKQGDHDTHKQSQSRQYAYAWFLYNSNDPSADITPVPSPTGDYEGMNQSLELIRNELLALQHQSPPAGPIFLLGFSQGAVMVHKIATMSCDSDSLSIWKSIQKCILVSGFPFRSNIANDQHDGCDETHVVMRSLHVVGTNDRRVPPTFTRQVYQQEQCFRGQYTAWEHDRGHVIPTDQAFCDCLLDFLAKDDE